MRHLNIFVFTLALAFGITQGLQCWRCDNAVDDEDCKNKGELMECRDNEEMCYTETRLIQIGRKFITRRCKQALACKNNYIQNPRAAFMPSQCNQLQGSVCRCCCDHDGCNGNEETQCSMGGPKEEVKEIKESPPVVRLMNSDIIRNNPEVPEACNIVEELENGFVSCESNGDRTKVVCTYDCFPGFFLFGDNSSLCESSIERGPTEHTVPECIPMFGPANLFDQAMDYEEACEMPDVPLHGYVECFSQDYEEGTDCIYSCQEGFVLDGPSMIWCLSDKAVSDDLVWSSSPPTCRAQCLELDSPENGMMSCYDVNGVRGIGSYCLTECNPGYILNGDAVTTCYMNKDGVHGYDNHLPTCDRILQCEPLDVPEHGAMICDHETIENGIGTICEFSCDVGYEMIGDKESFCDPNIDLGAAYSIPPPVCQPIQCPMPSNLRRVVRKCTNGDNYNSVCQFQCEQAVYTPNPGDVMENSCQIDKSWSSPPPCCRLPCPPHTIMDLVIVLDSSSSVKKKNWDKTVKFVAGIVSKLHLNYQRSQVFIIRFNGEVDRKNQLLLRNNENETEVAKALDTIPYDGFGTETGKALRYVREDLLKRPENRKNVTDVVLLLTDGRASDDVKTPSQLLRDDGVEMFAIGVGKAKKKQLLEITGSRQKLWPAMTNFDALTVDAATRIGQYICEQSCA